MLFTSSVAGYFILRHVIVNATRESLLEKKRMLIEQIRETGEISNLYPVLEVQKLDRLSGREPGFSLILINNMTEDEVEPYIEYSEELKIGDSLYSLKLRQSSFESEDLIIILSLSFFTIIFFSLGISFFISRRMNRTIWTDFERNLETIEHYNFSKDKKISLVHTDIEEFNRLNRVIENLTEKLSADYLSLKEFTENASHEIQTPLSVALLQLDEALQNNLNEEVFKKTITAIKALKRLSLLNQSLLLLAKIENKQFNVDVEVSMNDLIKRKIKEFETLFEIKKLHVEVTYDQDFILKINTQLADILLNNLLSNAINHNLEGGTIHLDINPNELKICNTGNPNTLTHDTVFNRFSKGNSKSYGLGLAIVKKICDTNYLDIKYEKNDIHCFTITKNS